MSSIIKLGELGAGAQYLARPVVFQPHLIPDSASAVLNSHWAVEHKAIPNAEFYLVKGAYVIDEGLVFTSDVALIAQTRVDFSEREVERARTRLLHALAGSTSIARETRGVFCKKRGARNYGHWLVESLPKAYWARRKLDIRDWPIVVPACESAMQAVIRDSLAMLGVPATKILETGDEPAYFEELIIVIGLTAHSQFISPLAFDCFSFIADMVPGRPASSLYALRSPARYRDFEERETADRVLLDDGYLEIECGNLPFISQVGAFKSAWRVTGAMGAAFANAVFCRPGTELLLFMPASALEVFYWHIAEAKRLNYFEIRTEEAGQAGGNLPWDRDLRIDPTAMRNLLRKLNDRRKTVMPYAGIDAPVNSPFSQ